MTERKPERVARLQRRTLHILNPDFVHPLRSLAGSLCGIVSVGWRFGFEWDERIVCKTCLKKWRTRNDH